MLQDIVSEAFSFQERYYAQHYSAIANHVVATNPSNGSSLGPLQDGVRGIVHSAQAHAEKRMW